jgi:hypothetical protein
MDGFTQAIEGWHDFYLMIGAAAATLVGLLFVSLSLNVDAITHPENDDLRMLAAQTFVSFICVVAFSVLFLIPDVGSNGLGLPLLGIGAYGLYRTASQFSQTRRKRPHAWGRGGIARRFVIPIVCFVTLVVIALSVLLRRTDGLYWLVPVMILLIVSASSNAWELLMRLGKPPKAS